MARNCKSTSYISQPSSLLSSRSSMIYLCSMLRIPLTLLGCWAVLSYVMQHTRSSRMLFRPKSFSKSRCPRCNTLQVFLQFLI